ncbi:uncharacterized protein LOC136752462 [Amia ocellicauda]|uniref:uncharacterized protein LOC136752462 n=1 Tax=Amia ocellicauda TaxID=2972642 RepID=UPI0034648259
MKPCIFTVWLSVLTCVGCTDTDTSIRVESERAEVCGELGKSVLLSVSYNLPRNNLLDTAWEMQSSTSYMSIYRGSSTTKAYQGRVEVFPNGSLLLKDLRSSDEARYTFSVALKSGEEREATVDLCIEDRVQNLTIEKIPNPSGSGQSARLVCKAPKARHLRVLWQGVNSSSQVWRSFRDFEEAEVIVMSQHCGELVCVAENNVSHLEMRHKLNRILATCENCELQCNEMEKTSEVSTLAVALSVGILVLLIASAVILCIRRHRTKCGKEEKKMVDSTQQRLQQPGKDTSTGTKLDNATQEQIDMIL